LNRAVSSKANAVDVGVVPLELGGVVEATGIATCPAGGAPLPAPAVVLMDDVPTCPVADVAWESGPLFGLLPPQAVSRIEKRTVVNCRIDFDIREPSDWKDSLMHLIIIFLCITLLHDV